MWEWSDKLKLGKSSAFVKRDIRSLPLTEAEFEADFFLDPVFSTKRQQCWMGMVIGREFGAVLAMEDVRLPPPTVNCLATLVAHAMLRPLDAGNRQRPAKIYLRDRPQWQELLPHLRQLEVDVILGDNLPWFDEAIMDWVKKATKPPSRSEIQAALRKPFPERKRSWFTDAMNLLEWTDTMCKGTYPSRTVAVPAYDPTTVVPIHLTAEELESILIQTSIAKTKRLRPRLEVMGAEGTSIDLDIHEWSRILLALCGTRAKEMAVRRHQLGTATRIANQLADTLGIAPPSSNSRSCHHLCLREDGPAGDGGEPTPATRKRSGRMGGGD